MGIKGFKLQTKRRLLTTIGILVAVGTLVMVPINSYAATPATWSLHPSADDTKLWRDVAWSPELKLFVAVGSSSIMTSSDGVTWTSRTSPPGTWASVAWSPEMGKFVAVGTGSSNNMTYSSDGINWATAPVGASTLNAITWSPEKHQFVAVGIAGTHSVIINPDLSFTPSPVLIQGQDGVVWSKNDNAYVAVAGGASLGRTYISTDGLNWTLNNTPPVNGPWTDIAYAEDQDLYVIVGTNGVMTSNDGVTWTSHTSPLTNLINITYSPENGEFVAVGDGGGIETSPDGVTWTAVSLSTTNNWRGITWSPELSRYVGVANAGTNLVLVGLIPKVSNAPLNLTATSSIGATKADISWNVPSFDGNTTITGYRLERSMNGGAFTTRVTNITGTTFQDTGLDPNATYKYRVFAINAIGESITSNEAILTRVATLADTGVNMPLFIGVAALFMVAGASVLIRKGKKI
jgi:hypothetical protein